jgi:hypothetical protein
MGYWVLMSGIEMKTSRLSGPDASFHENVIDGAWADAAGGNCFGDPAKASGDRLFQVMACQGYQAKHCQFLLRIALTSL